MIFLPVWGRLGMGPCPIDPSTLETAQNNLLGIGMIEGMGFIENSIPLPPGFEPLTLGSLGQNLTP